MALENAPPERLQQACDTARFDERSGGVVRQQLCRREVTLRLEQNLEADAAQRRQDGRHTINFPGPRPTHRVDGDRRNALRSYSDEPVADEGVHPGWHRETALSSRPNELKDII